MRIQTINSIDAAMAEGRTYPFVYLRTLSTAAIGTTEDIPIPPELNEVEELRFFGEAAEIRLYRQEGTLLAAKLEDGEDLFLTEECSLLPGFGKRLTKRRLLTFDEDGQAAVSAVRLVHWEG